MIQTYTLGRGVPPPEWGALFDGAALREILRPTAEELRDGRAATPIADRLDAARAVRTRVALRRAPIASPTVGGPPAGRVRSAWSAPSASTGRVPSPARRAAAARTRRPARVRQ
jgi:hypothetical protein